MASLLAAVTGPATDCWVICQLSPAVSHPVREMDAPCGGTKDPAQKQPALVSDDLFFLHSDPFYFDPLWLMHPREITVSQR